MHKKLELPESSVSARGSRDARAAATWRCRTRAAHGSTSCKDINDNLNRSPPEILPRSPALRFFGVRTIMGTIAAR